MKNVSLIDSFHDGKKTWKLLGPDGEPIQAFEVFSIALIRRHPYNTRSAYCRSIAVFIDYLFEAAATLGASPGDLTRSQLVAVIESYVEWLVVGESSGSEIARAVCATYPSPLVGASTRTQALAALTKFLALSEVLRDQVEQMAAEGLLHLQVAAEPLMPELTEQRELTDFERQALRARSMLAGCISGGPKLMKACVFPNQLIAPYFDQERAFPFDKVPTLIGSFTTYRDKALYALIAATGCRGHEALQLLWDDIDIGARKVRLVDPARRPNCPSYQALTAEERERLSWKGRATEETLLIQPFTDMFFQNLELYLRHEYLPHGRHRFVFQYAAPGKPGRPYFLSAASSRLEVFNRAKAKAGMDLDLDNAGHGLRHMYGVYAVNYFPRQDGGYGLPIAVVQKIMGHRSRDATEKYARVDKDMIAAELEFANNLVYGRGTPVTLLELKRNALQAQLAAVEAALTSPPTALPGGRS